MGAAYKSSARAAEAARCPIDVDRFLEEAERTAGIRLTGSAEMGVREIVAAINQAYGAGRHGLPGYPIDQRAEVERMRQEEGTGVALDVLMWEIRWINGAYRQGRRDAGYT